MSPASRRPTSRDVAAYAGVSRATVSMVLNDRVEGTVAEATRQKVLEAARELGYTRSAVALSLKQQRTRTIGLITDEIATSPWAGRMVRAASRVAAEHDHMVITVDLSLRDYSLEDALRMLSERQVDGLVYATMGSARVRLPPLPAWPPMVLLNCEDATPGRDLPGVVPDDRGGAREAARRLLDAGHERLVMLTGADESVAVAEREAGFREELEAAGLPVRIVPTGWQMSDGMRETRRLLAEDAPPTALFCIRDRVAAGAIHAAALAGVDVPGGLSVIGFDDEDFFAGDLTPALTTVALPHAEMGERAMRRLLARMGSADGEAPASSETSTSEDTVSSEGDGTDTAGPNRELVPCPLVERASVAEPIAHG